MEKTTLTVARRTVAGKKVKKLRLEGLIPANLFGKKTASVAVQVPIKELLSVYKKVGETGLLEIKLDKDVFPVLISNVQFEPLTRQPLHAEFHIVSLTEKIKANVLVELVGESPAVKDVVGLLLQTLAQVEVEALPADLPEKIELDVAELTEVGQQIVVADLPKLKGVEILSGREEVIVKLVPAVSEETKKETEAAAAAKAAAEASAAPAETEAAASETIVAPTVEEEKK